MNSTFKFFTLVLCFSALSLAGQSLTDTLLILPEEVTVTARRFEDDAFKMPEAVSILKRREIETSNFSTTPDVVSSLPGVWMQRTNLGGGSPFIRGLTGYQTLILVDGIRLNNSTFRSGPNQYLNTIDPLVLSRVEVLPGSGSVQYGTDAIGGVLNLLSSDLGFTDGPLEAGGTIYGKWRSSGMELSTRGEAEVVAKTASIRAGVSYSDFGDIRAGGDLGTLAQTGYDVYSFDVKSKFRLGTNATLTGAYQFLEQQDVPLYHKLVTGDFERNHFDPQQRQLGYLRYARQGQGLFANLEGTVSYQRSEEGRQQQRAESDIIQEESDVVNTLGVSLQLKSNILRGEGLDWYAVTGSEFYFDNIESLRRRLDMSTSLVEDGLRGLYPDGSESANSSVFHMQSLDIQRFAISAGVRFNHVTMQLPTEEFGEVTIKTPAFVWNTSVSYELTDNHRLSIQANRSFRAPNINDVSSFGVADFRYEVPNYDLEPEKGLNLEAGWKMQYPRWSASAHVFRNRLTDLIVNERSTFNGQDTIQGIQVYQRVNLGEAEITGFEAQTRYLLSNQWQVEGQLAYTYGRAAGDDRGPLRRIPPLNGRMQLRYRPVADLSLTGQWIFADSQTRLSGGDIDDDRIADGGTPSWHLFNLQVNYTWRQLQMNVGLENVFDKAYRMHGSGIDGLGRNLWISMRFKI